MRFDFDTVVGLIRLGIGTIQSWRASVAAGKLAVQSVGTDLTAEQLQAKLEAVNAKADEVGQNAADRIEGRHPDGE